MKGRVLVIGVGGLSCPALRVLARSGVRDVTLVDDDVVDESNLQRQVLFDDEHVGMSKAEVAAAVLTRSFPGFVATPVVARFVPENALALIDGHDVVLEGADNFATKFLAFDAARIANRPIVQAGAVRWSGWALASAPAPGRGACLRCVFEDVPGGDADTCAVAGVVGPVVGAVGALEAALALRVLHHDDSAFGELFAYDAAKPRLRRSRPAARPGCASCSGSISDLSRDRYAPSCAA